MDKKGMKQSSLLNFFSKSPKSASASPAITSKSPALTNGSPAVTTNGKSSPKSTAVTPKASSSYASTNGTSSHKSVAVTPKASSSYSSTNGTPKRDVSTLKEGGANKAPKRNKIIYSSSDEDVKPAPKKAKTTISDTPKDKKSKRRSEKSSSKQNKDDSFSPGEDVSSSEDYSSHEESELPSESEEEYDDAKRTPKRKVANNSKNSTKEKLANFKTPNGSNKKAISSPAVSSKNNRTPGTPSTNVNDTTDNDQWEHLTYKFLKPENLRDRKMRKMSHPEYDPTSLDIPLDFLKARTPGHKQWWMFKRDHFDTILFFKVGKFYEFYHMDAVIANRELGIIFMKGSYAHSGFPEPSYTYFASTLVQKGYKVARIEQVETPDMMDKRCKKTGKKDKVVNRAICEISTKGVRLPSFQNADSSGSSQATPDSSFFYCVIEKQKTENEADIFEYGVCFVDTSVGTFFLGQFTDGTKKSRLTTMFSKYPPVQVVYCKDPKEEFMTADTLKMLTSMNDLRVETMTSDKFWEPKATIDFLVDQNLFVDEKTGNCVFPEAFENLIHNDPQTGAVLLINDEDWGLALKCLGGVIQYLANCRCHIDLLSLGRFQLYYPMEHLKDIPTNINTVSTHGAFMTIDSVTLKTLEIVEGPNNVLSVLDRCRTPFGKRLLRLWLCQPLGEASQIEQRLDAVENLMGLEELTEKLTSTLTSIPDLERLVNKMHILGSEHRSKLHPDGQAQLYESVKYSKNKILDFVNLLKGMKKCRTAISLMNNDFTKDIKSALLRKLIEDFPDLEDFFEYFDRAFNPDAAMKEGRIIPTKGSCLEYDNSLEEIENVKQESTVYLKKLCKEFNCGVEYFGSDKRRFQIQLPDHKKVSTYYKMSSSKKGFKRYTTEESEDFLKRLIAAEKKRDAVLGDVTRQMFWQFDQSRELWITAIKSIAVLDVLVSLAKYSKNYDMCRPVLRDSEEPYLKIVQGRHPSFFSDTYIPNDCYMSSTKTDGGRGNFILLTGANMGGKSTLMRQVGLIAILSHIGCYVPAESCELSTIDRVFTRIGANDNICGGESTFHVEVSETASVLRYGTKKSLVLIDELGRGTATYDGMSIAQAVATYLADKDIRTVFATHYHTLAYGMKEMESVQLKHMAFEVKKVKEGNDDVDKLTFLYVMVDGHCDKSYGFHAARISGVPHKIVSEAQVMGDKFEEDVTKVNAFRSHLMEMKKLLAAN